MPAAPAPEGLKDVLWIQAENTEHMALKSDGTLVSWRSAPDPDDEYLRLRGPWRLPAGAKDVAAFVPRDSLILQKDGFMFSGPVGYPKKQTGFAGFAKDDYGAPLVLCKEGNLFSKNHGTPEFRDFLSRAQVLSGYRFSAEETELRGEGGLPVESVSPGKTYEAHARILGLWDEPLKASVILQLRGGEGASKESGGAVLYSSRKTALIPVTQAGIVTWDVPVPAEAKGLTF